MLYTDFPCGYGTADYDSRGGCTVTAATGSFSGKAAGNTWVVEYSLGLGCHPL